MLIPIQMRGAADVLTREPKDVIKYDGFKKLEELFMQNNKIHQIPELVGLVCLPCLKRVFISGNPVVQKYASKLGSYDKSMFLTLFIKINYCDRKRSIRYISFHL